MAIGYGNIAVGLQIKEIDIQLEQADPYDSEILKLLL